MMSEKRESAARTLFADSSIGADIMEVIHMKREKSCGAVVFTRTDDGIRYILIQNKQKIYGFPKGHVENGETEKETAKREILEETGLSVELLDGFRMDDCYRLPGTKTMKDVVYFLGYFEGQVFRYQEKELSGIALLSYEEAVERLPFVSLKRILTAANDLIKGELF